MSISICSDCGGEIWFGPRGCLCTQKHAKEHARKQLRRMLEEVGRVLNEDEMRELKRDLAALLQ